MPQVVCTPNQPRNFTVIFFCICTRLEWKCGLVRLVDVRATGYVRVRMRCTQYYFYSTRWRVKIIAFHVRVMALQAAHMFLFSALVPYVRRMASIDSIVGDLMVCLVFVCPIQRSMRLRFMNLLFAGRVTPDDASRWRLYAFENHMLFDVLRSSKMVMSKCTATQCMRRCLQRQMENPYYVSINNVKKCSMHTTKLQLTLGSVLILEFIHTHKTNMFTTRHTIVKIAYFVLYCCLWFSFSLLQPLRAKFKN